MNFGFWLALCSALLAGGIAFATACRGKPTLPHWSFAAGLTVLAIESFCAGLSTDGLLFDTIAYWQGWSLCAMAFLPGIWLLFSVTYSRGNYREFLKKWRLPLGISFLAPISLAAIYWSRLVLVTVDAQNRPILRLSTPGLALVLLFLLGSVLVVMNLEATFRATVGTMRWRIKFMTLGLGVLFAVRAYTSSQLLLFRSIHLPLQELNAGALLLACLLILRSLFRTGHFEVSVFPSQAVLQNSLTIFLAGAYLIIVGVLAKLVAFLGGDSSFERKAFVVLASLVLLTVVLLSDRVRLYTKRFVSRHFQRPLYDYRTVWRNFAESTAKCVEQSDLCTRVVKLVSEVFQALSVSIWLVDEKKDKLLFGASTSISRAEAGSLALAPAETAELIVALSSHTEPLDIDSSREPWAAALRRSHPYEFTEGGNRVCVPLIASGEVLGILVLGDRVGGISFSAQDFDLLKSASDQAAASLLNMQLSQQLSQAKQLEAFQAMSAFFVHDLKNTASTLSLMLRNLPIHYQDPKFREDALRGIAKTVEHINDLVTRLTSLRHDLEVKAVDCDLNKLVTECLKSYEQAPGLEVVKELQPVTKLRADAVQIEKVITNLVLNARESLTGNGRILVATSQSNGWAVLSVSDNGCGMSADFINRSLFRPFNTTKKKGIGIGMFHCKMIVEAHHGRIEVQSEPGKGSTFRVLLPSANNS